MQNFGRQIGCITGDVQVAYIEFALCTVIKEQRGRIANSCSEERQVIEPNRDCLKPLLDTEPLLTRINSPSPLQNNAAFFYFIFFYRLSAVFTATQKHEKL